MQITIVCVACAKRYLADDKALEKGMVCPACGGAMKSAPKLNIKNPTPVETYDPFWNDMPSASMGRLRAQDDLTKKVLYWGGMAVGAILLLGTAWILYGKFSGGPDAVVAAKPAEPPKPVEPTPTPTAETANELASTPAFVSSSALTPSKLTGKGGKAKKSVADLIEAEGDGVVHISVYDGHGELYGTGSGLIIGRHKIDEWIEPEVKKDQGPPKGELWLVATNHHVIAGASGASVRMRDGTIRKARGLISYNRDRDLAILALDDAPKKLKIMQLFNENAIRQGEEVMAIGHPKGFDFTVSTGIISAIRGSRELPEEVAEQVHAPEDQQWVQTTAAITNGNSGGPLMTMTGEVIGINTWGFSSAGNLAFASHIKHLADMNKTSVVVDHEKKARVKLLPFSEAKPADVAERIGDKGDWLESEVREELERSAKRAIAIDWRPSTKGDYVSFQAVATMLTLSAVYRFNVPEIKPLSESLSKRKWEFETEVKQINQYALENLSERQWGVFFFGKIRRINSATNRHLWVDLTGRGHVVAVTIPQNQTTPKLSVGDDIAVLGYRTGLAPENNRLPRGVHNILAGLVLPVTLPPVPEDVVLQQAYDLVKHHREDQGFDEYVRKFADVYERVVPLLGKQGMRWQRLNLNSRGRQFDAVRFSVPPTLNCDLIWSFNCPDDSIEEWGVMPVGNFPIRIVGNSFTYRNMPAPQLSKEESKHVILQCLSGGLLVPDEDYLLWFTFKNSAPRRVAVSIRVVPTGSFEAQNQLSVGNVAKDGAAFRAEDMNRMIKVQQERAAAEANKPPSTPTKATLVKPMPSDKPEPSPSSAPSPDSSAPSTSPPTPTPAPTPSSTPTGSASPATPTATPSATGAAAPATK